MANVDRRLTEALRQRLRLSERQLRRLIEQKVRETFLDRHLAALLVAAEVGINPARFGSSEDLAAIRGARNGSGDSPVAGTAQLRDDLGAVPSPVPTRGPTRTRGRLGTRSKVKRDPKRVFVVYGRNSAAYDAMVLFLQSLRLLPRDFLEIRNELRGAPFIGDIVRSGIERAQATIVVFTPDEVSFLRPELIRDHDPDRERQRWQGRPNVIFEAGMALATDERRTLLVTLGSVALPSDLDGRHLIRLDNSTESRKLLKEALESVDCDVDGAGRWHDAKIAGDFESCLRSPALSPVELQSPFVSRRNTGGQFKNRKKGRPKP